MGKKCGARSHVLSENQPKSPPLNPQLATQRILAMISPFRTSLLAAAFAVAITGPESFATNGMNMEGYGPVASSMGGASFAYDNGIAGVMNNPATLSLQESAARLDLALGVLGPDVSATSPTGISADSSATAFFMPAFGYTRRHNDLVYGLAVFGQGGMGTEYNPNSWLGLGNNLVNRTEVSVGRVILPFAYQVNERLHIGATVDFVWAGMDLQMAMTGNQFFDFVDPTSQKFGRASGSIVQRFGQIMASLPPGSGVDYAYFDFTNDNDFTGEARGYGYAGKIGLTYDASEQLTLGLTYHSRTNLGDLKAPGNSLAFQLNVAGVGPMPQTLSGDFRVNDFEWPAMLGGGFAFRLSPQWLLVGDLRHVFWADVMSEFSMTFTADRAPTNGPFANQIMDAIHFQEWSDRTIIQLGAAYQATDQWTLRFGFNHGANPVPNQYLNALFPAIVETHFTAGFGYQIDDRHSVDVSATYGVEAKETSGNQVRVGHRQLNAQILYSFLF